MLDDPWADYIDNWVEEQNRWPKPLWHRLFEFWVKVDRAMCELLSNGRDWE